MKRLSLFLLLLSALSAFAQQEHEQTNAGTDFWVTDVVTGNEAFVSNNGDVLSQFSQNLSVPDHFSDTAFILILGNENCSGYAENPFSGWYVDFVVSQGNVTTVPIPENEIMCYILDDIQSKSIHIHTDAETFVYMVTNKRMDYVVGNNETRQSSPQKFQIPPANVARNDYRLPITVGLGMQEESNSDCCNLVNYSSYHALSQSYLIVAHEDETEVLVSGHFESPSLMSSTEQPTDLVWIPETSHQLQRGEVLVIPRVASENGPVCFAQHPQEAYVDIHVNCKKVSVFQHRTFLEQVTSRMPLETFSPFHPNLNGRDFLTVYSGYDGCVGYLRSDFCGDNEETTQFSHNVIYVNELNILHEDAFCYCRPYIYRFSILNSYFHGHPRFIYNSNQLLAGEVHGCYSPPSSHLAFTDMAVSQLPYADKTVKKVLFPTSSFDTNFSFNLVRICISTSPEGRYTTFVNGNLIPDSLFLIDDATIGRYYIAELIYDSDIPEIFDIENPNGISVYFEEIHPYCYYSNREFATATFTNSGCTYDLSPIRPNIGVGVTTFCANDTLMVFTEGNCENYPITWTIEDSTFTVFDNDTMRFPLFSVDTLHFSMIVEKYCPDTLVDTVYVVLRPHLSLPADTLVCRGAPITAHSDMFGFFHWSNGTADSTFIPTEEGEYSVRIHNACGSDSATINVRFYGDPLSVDFGDDTLLCRLATLLLDATQQHPASYLWHDNSTNTTYTVIDDGQYWVVVTDDCEGVSDTINVTYLYDFQVNLGNDTTICSEQPFTLDATTPYSHYLWNDGTTSATHEVTTSGTYSVHVYNACAAADASVTIEVEECDALFFAPSAFTPNGDGLNDAWRPIFNHPERLEKYELRIFDRWGRLLFSTDNPYQGWSGDDLPVGVYAWMMEYQGSGEGSKIVTGNVTLAR
ncbi:MAG: gliding motility-associated C-terminal domain-containing protein [Bacteroidales bacterium]|nr:gliding motility-associated C-terminal domain-containing protein [Bacteroidales bacterium]